MTLIKREDAIEAVHEYFRARLAESDGEWNDELQEYVFSKEDKRLLEYNKGVNTALKALPLADAVHNDSCDGCKYIGVIEKCEQCRRIYTEFDDLYDKGGDTK